MAPSPQLSCLFLLACVLIPCQFAPPPRCVCKVAEQSIHEPIADFKIIEKGTYCTNNEIIVTLKRANIEVCLSPEGKGGQHLLRCWDRINKDESLKLTCLRKKKPN